MQAFRDITLSFLLLASPVGAAEHRTNPNVEWSEPENEPPQESGVLDRTPWPKASPSPAPEASPTPIVETSKPGASELARAARTLGVSLHFSPLDLLIPFKYGASLSYVASAATTFEVEYLRGSVSSGLFGLDLFDLKDERLSLMARSFVGNSLNFHYGATYFHGSGRVGLSDFQASPTGEPLPERDLWRSQGAGFNAGIGNRWMAADHIAIGIDWISWAQPLWAQQDSSFPEERVASSIRKDFRWISYFPRVTLLHLQAGIYF